MSLQDHHNWPKSNKLPRILLFDRLFLHSFECFSVARQQIYFKKRKFRCLQNLFASSSTCNEVSKGRKPKIRLTTTTMAGTLWWLWFSLVTWSSLKLYKASDRCGCVSLCVWQWELVMMMMWWMLCRLCRFRRRCCSAYLPLNPLKDTPFVSFVLSAMAP